MGPDRDRRGRQPDYSPSNGNGSPNPADPEVARHECIRWYYMIVPPSTVPVADGAAYDWPGPDYDSSDPDTDPRHYKRKNHVE